MTAWGAVRGRYRAAANPLRTERGVELVAVILGLVLCLQLLYSGARLAMAPVFDAVAPAADVLQVTPVDSSALVASDQSDEIRARPLFWEGRSPIEETTPQVVPDGGKKRSGQLKEVKLLGIFGSGNTAGIIALVKGQKQRILQGESVAGWTLDVVESNRVVLVEGGRREKLVLKTGVVIAAADAAVANSSAGKPAAERNKKTITNKGTGSVARAKRGERRLSSGGVARGGRQ
ncbi:MAG: hypothetical protein DRR04_03415 [Gammaproteobacteria bacterium]|nr:MAG: hypothetical protein DRQ97_02275 [Gammaproteobacteria bacterium]RLA61214.1 MAG: hypothetical protein DRR04_03415 [Gammaproteobacteria bacterium]